MATYTNRLKLRKPDYGDFVNVDTDVNAQMQIIDDNINCWISTAGSRPIGPQNGQLLYETDTENIYILDAGIWLLIGNRKFGQGKKAFTLLTVAGATFSNVEAGPFLTATLNVNAIRKYLVEAQYNLQHVATSSGNANNCQLTARWRWAAGAAVTTAGNLLGQYDNNIANFPADDQTFYKMFEWFPAITGQATIGLFLLTKLAPQSAKLLADNVDKPATLAIKDWGI